VSTSRPAATARNAILHAAEWAAETADDVAAVAGARAALRLVDEAEAFAGFDDSPGGSAREEAHLCGLRADALLRLDAIGYLVQRAQSRGYAHPAEERVSVVGSGTVADGEYRVTMRGSAAVDCTCHDWRYRRERCKHMGTAEQAATSVGPVPCLVGPRKRAGRMVK
jgi:hypothetical protein